MELKLERFEKQNISLEKCTEKCKSMFGRQACGHMWISEGSNTNVILISRANDLLTVTLGCLIDLRT